MTNKNEEKFCVLFEILLVISDNNFENIIEILNTHNNYLRKYLNRDFDFFTSIVLKATKENYNSIVVLFKTIISLSIIGDLPKIPYECFTNSRKLQSLLTNINCKKKLKDIINFCKETIGNANDIDFYDLTNQIINNFQSNNQLPDMGSISLAEDNMITLQYESSKNSLVEEYKKNEDTLPLLISDITLSAYISDLLLILTEEQEKQINENPLDRILFFKDKPFISPGKVITDKNDQKLAITYINQSTFIIPYKNKKTSTLFNTKTAAYKVMGFYIENKEKNNKRNVYEPFIFENLKFNQLEKLFKNDNSMYSDGIPNILVRLTPQNNNSKYLETLIDSFKELNTEYVNIFICNPQSQVMNLLNSLKKAHEAITYIFLFSDDVRTLEIKPKHSPTFRIYLRIDEQRLLAYNFKLGEIAPSKNEKINVSLFQDLLIESDLVKQLNSKKLFT